MQTQINNLNGGVNNPVTTFPVQDSLKNNNQLFFKPGSMQEQFRNLSKSIDMIASNIDKPVFAKLFTGTHSLYSALKSIYKISTTLGQIEFIVKAVAGGWVIWDTLKETKLPEGVDEPLNYADSLICMVNKSEERNLTEIDSIKRDLHSIGFMHIEIEEKSEVIENKMQNSSKAIKEIYDKALEALQIGAQNTTEAKKKYIKSENLIEDAHMNLRKATNYMKRLREILRTSSLSPETVKILFKKMTEIIEEAVKYNEVADDLLTQSRATSREGQEASTRSTRAYARMDTYLEMASKMQDDIKKSVIDETSKIAKHAEDAIKQLDSIRNSVKEIENNIKANQKDLIDSQEEISKARAIWNRFLSYQAAFFGMLTVAVVGPIISALVSASYAIAMSIFAGMTVATLANNSHHSPQDIVGKINTFLFGETEKKLEVLPQNNTGIAVFDKLSSSLIGKLKKQSSRTVGRIYLNIAGEQLSYRFDMRKRYPIGLENLKKIVNKIKLAIEKEPSSINLETLDNSFIFSEGKYANKHLFDERAKLFFDDFRKLQDHRIKELTVARQSDAVFVASTI